MCQAIKWGVLFSEFLGILIFSGCGHVYEREFSLDRQTLAHAKTICVLPLENLTDTPEAGQVVTELLIAELHQLQKFRVLSASEISELFREQKIRLPKTIDRWIAAEIGRRLQADAVWIGSVTEYHYRTDFSPEEEEEEPIVGINLRVVDVKTSSVLWGSSQARSSYEVFSYEKDPLSRVAMKTVRSMLDPFRGI